jgi:hypothetical protein
MRIGGRLWVVTFAMALGLVAVPGRTLGQDQRGQDKGQDKQHVVSLDELNSDAARPVQARQANEKACGIYYPPTRVRRR